MIKRLEIENLFSIEDIVLDNLDELDVIGVVGSYEGKEGYSNASGKSSIVEGVCLAITGKHRYKTDIEAIRINEDFMRVKVIDIHDGNELSIERIYQKKKSKRSTSAFATVMLNGDVKAEGMEASQAFINKYFGLTPDDFINSHFFRQREYDALLKTRSTERIKFLQKFFKSYIFDNARKASAKDRLIALGDVKRLEGEISTLEDEKAQTDKTSLKSKMMKSKEQLVSLKEKRISTEKKLTAIRKRRDKESRILAENAANIEKAAELQDKIEVATDKRDSLKVRRNVILKKIAEIKQDLVRAVAKLKALPDSTWNEENNKEMSDLMTRKEQLLVRVEINKQNMKTAKKYLKDIQANMCPWCNQGISAEYRNLQSTVKKKEILTMEKKGESLEDSYNESVDQWIKMTAEKEESIKIDKRKSMLNTEKKKLEAICSSENNLSAAIAEQIKELVKTKEDTVAEKGALVVRFVDNSILIKINEEGKRLKSAVGELNTAIEVESARGASLAGTIKRLEQVTKQLRAAKKEEKELRQQVANHFTVESIFEKCKLEIVTVGLKEIEESACDIIGRIGAVHKAIEFDTQKETQKGDVHDCLDIYLVDGKGKRNVMGLCGGEWYTAAFAIRAAMAKYKLMRMNSKVDFLILDEVFGSLDKNSRQELAAVINMFKNDFSQVFVISHTDLQESIENVIHVEMGKDEITRLKETIK